MNFKKVVALSICAAMVAGMSMSTVMAADLPDQFKDLKANEAYEFPTLRFASAGWIPGWSFQSPGSQVQEASGRWLPRWRRWTACPRQCRKQDRLCHFHWCKSIKYMKQKDQKNTLKDCHRIKDRSLACPPCESGFQFTWTEVFRWQKPISMQ